MKDQDGKDIEVGDTVYENKLGWSSVSLKVWELRTITANGKEVDQVNTRPAPNGWLGWYAAANLTHESNRRGTNSEGRSEFGQQLFEMGMGL